MPDRLPDRPAIEIIPNPVEILTTRMIGTIHLSCGHKAVKRAAIGKADVDPVRQKMPLIAPMRCQSRTASKPDLAVLFIVQPGQPVFGKHASPRKHPLLAAVTVRDHTLHMPLADEIPSAQHVISPLRVPARPLMTRPAIAAQPG